MKLLPIPKKVLFICLGNICRSPSAEAVFRKKAKDLGLDLQFDSAGTIDHHRGEKSDHRSIRFAEKRGYEMRHLARQLGESDFTEFDLLLVMDYRNEEHVLRIAPPEHRHKIDLITRHCSVHASEIVPDPYYGGPADFELVLDLLEASWIGFVKRYFPSAMP